jgi:hypothetical protein
VIAAIGASNKRVAASSWGGSSVVVVVSTGWVVVGASVTFVTIVVGTSVAVVVVSVESPLLHDATIKARTPMIGNHLALMIHLLVIRPPRRRGGNRYLPIKVWEVSHSWSPAE